MRATPLKTIAHILGQQSRNSTLVHSVAIDSRLVQRGSLFFALKGVKSDGHHFLEEAFARGAVAAVVDQSSSLRGERYLAVPDVLQALHHLAHTYKATLASTMIGITGSMGKTTTKDFLAPLLRQKYQVSASDKSYNSQATFPLSILNAEEAEILVLEMGMSLPGEMQKLVAIAPPDIALITNIGMQHLAPFEEGLQGVAREKAEILRSSHTSLALINEDSAYSSFLREQGGCRKVTFSLKNPHADYFLKVENREQVTLISKDCAGYQIPLSLPLLPLYENYLAAVAVARILEVSWESIKEGSKTLRPPPMRFELVQRGSLTFINDAYNCNPQSAVAALQELSESKFKGRKIAVLSEMTELGRYAEEGHHQVGESALKHVDLLLCLGKRCHPIYELWQKEQRACYLFTERAELELFLKQALRPGDVILLKGARSYALEEILKGY